jgi:hypothetical protein
VLSVPRLSEEDTYVVVRVERKASSPAFFATYVNGDLASNAMALNRPDGLVSHVVLTNPGLPSYESAIATLTVFDESEKGNAAGFAEAMRNPAAGYFAPIDRGSEDFEKAVEDREKAVEDKGKALEEKGKVLEDKEKALEDKENALEEKEKALDTREKAIAEMENSPKGGDGSDQASAHSNVLPSDAEMIQYSTATAWPRAVKVVLRCESNHIKQRHATLMSEWVVDRGDNLSSDAYDYSVYSHGVAWPKAILEATTYADLMNVQGKHQEIMKALDF